MEVIAVKPDTLELDPGNARAHDAVNMEAIGDSLRRFGQVEPLVVQSKTNRVIGGNGRLMAMRQNGWESCDIVYVDVDDAEASRLAIALNRTAEFAGWDKAVLAETLSGLPDLVATGFSEKDLSELLSDKPILDSATVPPPESAVVEVGDVWQIGRHRVACGDSSDPDVVAAVLDGHEPTLCVTDPPYGVEYDPGFRSALLGQCERRTQAVANDHISDWSDVFANVGSDVFYVWHSDGHANIVYATLRGIGVEIRNQIIWYKSHHVVGRGHYNYRHEPCVYGVRSGATANWVGKAGGDSTVWEFGIDGNAKDCNHSTQKPLEAMARPIRNHAGDVIDPFLGSGTTLVAAHQLGRVGYGIELSPGYCEASIRRIASAAGEVPVRESDGERLE